MEQALLFQNATLFTATEVVRQGSLLVQDGKIAALGRTGDIQAPTGTRILDLEGLIVAPGYIELQINGAFGWDFTQTPQSIPEVAAGLTAFGVTAFLPTIITSPGEVVQAAMEAWQQAAGLQAAGQQAAGRKIQGAVPFGLHLEGPMINPRKKGAHNPAYIQAPSLEEIEGWRVERGVWLVTLAPELPGAEEVIVELRRRGIVISAGHSLATYEQAKQAFQTGIGCGTHLFNAMPPLDHRSPGLVAALLQEPTVYAGLIVDGVHVHPAIVDLAWQAKGPDHLVLVSDAMAALGMQPGVYHLADNDVKVDQDSARLADGTLAGSLLTLDAAVRNLRVYTGCSLTQAVACASTNPARLMGLDSKGRLAASMDADLVCLTPEGEVLATLVCGRVCYSKIPVLEAEA